MKGMFYNPFHQLLGCFYFVVTGVTNNAGENTFMYSITAHLQKYFNTVHSE